MARKDRTTCACCFENNRAEHRPTTCREYAEAPALVEVRRTVQSGAASAATADVSAAFDVVFNLEVMAVRPGLEPGVSAAMGQASQMSVAMRKAWADSGELDPVAFERMAAYVDSACESAGVDMSAK